jgi:maleate isomerase
MSSYERLGRRFRIGLIVPSSNVTMETEIPAMLAARSAELPGETFTFHSSRMRMLRVSAEELKKMDGESDRCAQELADAQCDLIAYACLVAIMAQGHGYHCASEERLGKVAGGIPVVSSAGALVYALQALGARKIAVVTPYMKPLTAQVCDYIQHEGVEVVSAISREVPDNAAVGRLNPNDLRSIYKDLDLKGAEAIVLSACVQMPSLAAIQSVEDECGLPVISAATATTYVMLERLGLRTFVPRAGRLLSGSVASRTPVAAR